MSTSKPLWLSFVFFTMLASSVFARDEDTFGPVNQNAQERTGSAFVWEREQNAREQTLAMVRRLLKGPLSANTAAQITLLNNRGLQATFEEIGLAEADLIEARTISNGVRTPVGPSDQEFQMSQTTTLAFKGSRRSP